MLRLSCSFCAHRNPEGSQFCNQCGSPLNLVPCSQCEAINNLSDTQCSHCGAPLSSAATGELPVGSPSLAETSQSVGSAPSQDASVPLALADRLEAVPWDLRARKGEEPAAVGDHHPLAHHPLPAVGPAADPESHVDESTSPSYASLVEHRARNRYRVPGILLGILFVAVAGAAYWMSVKPTPPPDQRAMAGEAPKSASESIAHAPVSPQTADTPTESSNASTGDPRATANPVAPPTSSESPNEQIGLPSTTPKRESAAALAPARAHSAKPSAGRSDKANARAPAEPRRGTAARTREQAERDTLATQRLIDRELAEPAQRNVNSP